MKLRIKAIWLPLCILAYACVIKASKSSEQHSTNGRSHLLKPIEEPKPEFNDQISYVKDHFLALAEQRLKIWHYYILVWAASAAATLQIFSKENTNWIVVTTLGVIYIAISFIFTMIERRNIGMLDHAKAMLKRLESYNEWKPEARICMTDPSNSFFTFRTAFAIAAAIQLFAGCALIYLGFSAAARPAPETSPAGLSNAPIPHASNATPTTNIAAPNANAPAESPPPSI
jgi:hypothetical protein